MMNKKRNKVSVLVVDDDKSMCVYLETALSLLGYKVDSVKSGKEALERVRRTPEYSVIFLDIMMPEMDGLTTLKTIREFNNDLPIIMLSALGQTQTIVTAMKAGASDYVTKPFDDRELEIAIEKTLNNRSLLHEVQRLREELDDEKQVKFVTVSEKLLEMKRVLEKVADTDAPILIQGESGVGKEVLVNLIHSKSSRKAKPLIKVSCVAIPSDLLESELFGYEKGAFTGANVSRPGRFGLAHGGTIFLDEIGDMLPSLQAKLLQVLQDGVFTRLGSQEETRVNVRVLSATNRKLEAAIMEGSFREDLYHRINVINVIVPPLRERKEDIPVLCDHFLRKYSQMYNRKISSLSKGFMEACMNYDWPGNVRELENIVRKVVVLKEEQMVLEELALNSRKARGGTPLAQGPFHSSLHKVSLKDISQRAQQEIEKEMILDALKKNKWNKKIAAKKLGINYKTLLYKIKKFNI